MICCVGGGGASPRCAGGGCTPARKFHSEVGCYAYPTLNFAVLARFFNSIQHYDSKI